MGNFWDVTLTFTIDVFKLCYSTYYDLYSQLEVNETYRRISGYFAKYETLKFGNAYRAHETRYLDILLKLPINFCGWIANTVNNTYHINITPPDVLEKIQIEQYIYTSGEMNFYFSLDEVGRAAYKKVYGVDYDDVLKKFNEEVRAKAAARDATREKGDNILIVIIVLSLCLFTYR